MDTVFIFAGGEPLPDSLRDELPRPDLVIAADSGHEAAARLGFAVDVAIGDFDSLSPSFRISEQTEQVVFPRDKDATDLELAFQSAAGYMPRRVILVGAEGGRFDHEVAALGILSSTDFAAIPEIEWVRSDARVYVIRDAIRIQGDPGAEISLLAAGGDAVGVTTWGLAWSLAGETLAYGSSHGMSNLFQNPEATIRIERGTLLAIVPGSP